MINILQTFFHLFITNSYEDITIFGRGECDTIQIITLVITCFRGILRETPSTHKVNQK